MRNCVLLAVFFLLLPGLAQAKVPHWQIITPGLESRLADFYGGDQMPHVDLPKDNSVTICFGGGCAGQIRLTLDRAMEDKLSLVFLSQLTADTGEAERVAIGYATDYFYDLVKTKLVPRQSDDWIKSNLQTTSWECKTHAQNVTAVVYQLQRLGLLRHNRLGPVQYRSGHYFGTVYDANGARWQVDSYFGDTSFSMGANCRSDTPICIKRVW